MHTRVPRGDSTIKEDILLPYDRRWRERLGVLLPPCKRENIVDRWPHWEAYRRALPPLPYASIPPLLPLSEKDGIRNEHFFFFFSFSLLAIVGEEGTTERLPLPSSTLCDDVTFFSPPPSSSSSFSALPERTPPLWIGSADDPSSFGEPMREAGGCGDTTTGAGGGNRTDARWLPLSPGVDGKRNVDAPRCSLEKENIRPDALRCRCVPSIQFGSDPHEISSVWPFFVATAGVMVGHFSSPFLAIFPLGTMVVFFLEGGEGAVSISCGRLLSPFFVSPSLVWQEEERLEKVRDVGGPVTTEDVGARCERERGAIILG